MNTKRITTTALATVVVALTPASASASVQPASSDARASAIAGWVGPVIRPNRSAKVPTHRQLCGRGYMRDVYATKRGRRLPERALRRVQGTQRFRNLTNSRVRVRAVCLYPASYLDGVYLANATGKPAVAVLAMRLIGGTTVAPSARTRAAARERARERRAERRSQRRAARNGWLRA